MTTFYNPGIFAGIPVSQYPAMVNVTQWLRQQSLTGHADAQANLGTALAIGIGAAIHLEEAATWLEKAAAQQGNALAYYNLGVLAEDRQARFYYTGDAAGFYQKAVEQEGFLPAVMRLAQIDIDSPHPAVVKQAYKAFRKLSLLSGSQVIPVQREALFWLGACQLYGRGTTRRRDSGEALMTRSALLGFKPAQYFLYDYHALHRPSFPIDASWNIVGLDTLMPQRQNLQLVYIWHHLVPERRLYRDEYYIRQVTPFDRSLYDQEIASTRHALQEADALVIRHYRESTRWATESGLHTFFPVFPPESQPVNPAD